MIFVTVGTHEQPFNRLIQKVDELKEEGVITENVIIQTGFSTYEPKYCQWSKLIPYQQMIKNVADAVGTLADELTDGFHMEARGYLDREEVNARLIAFARKLEQVLDKWETHAALLA